MPRKLLALSVSAFVVFLSPPLFSHPIAWADENNSTLTLDPTGQPVAVVSFSEAPQPVESLPQDSLAGLSNTTDFQLEDGGIVEVVRGSEDDTEVSLESHTYNDAFYGNSNNYWFEQANAKEAHHLSLGTDVPVAVLDTGFDFNHEDRPLLWSNPGEVLDGIDNDGNGYVDDINGWDFYNRDNNPADDHGHGTAVSGVIGAAANNFLGVVGIAPQSRIIPIKVLNFQGSGFVSDVIKAIRYAADLGAKVINMSLGVFKNFLSKSLQNAFKDAVSYAKSKGTVTVAAAGNSNANVTNTYPAAIADLAVGAIDSNKNRASFSNYGNLLDLVAAGVSLLMPRATGTSFGSSCVSNSKYSCASGTSFSSPIVAGVVALLRAYDSSLTVDQIYKRLTGTAVDLGTPGFDKYYGYGLVDAYKALTLSSSSASAVQTEEVSASNRGSGNAFGVFKKSLEEIAHLPRLSPSPLPMGNWYFIRPLSTGYRSGRTRKKDLEV